MQKTPNVLCIGFAKCGTTTLYDIFKQHPDIYLSNIKEPLFWGNENLELRGFSWYLDRYYSYADKDIIMEINPMIGKYKSAGEIKKYYGDSVKIIVLIRNPIFRLYSNFKMNLIDGTSFSKISDNVVVDTSIAFDKWLFQEYIIDYDSLLFKDNPRMHKNGNYFKVIKDYINEFGVEKVKIVFFEDLIKDPTKECKSIMEFMDIDCNHSINYDMHSNSGNRIPKNQLSIIAVKKILNIIYNFEINPLFKCEQYDKFINYVSWKLFNVFSTSTNTEKVSELSYYLLSLYYYDMVQSLQTEIDVDLFDKWNISKDKQLILSKIRK